MHVLHANWTDGSMRWWAESGSALAASVLKPTEHVESGSIDASVGNTAPYHSGGVGVVERSAVLAHPFAATTRELLDVLTTSDCVCRDDLAPAEDMVLVLPGWEGVPWPSDRLAAYAGTIEAIQDPDPVRSRVPTMRMRNESTLECLLRLESFEHDARVVPGPTVRYWETVARFVIDLLSDQRFIPTMFQLRGEDFRASWQPWLHDDQARARVGALLVAMPTLVRAVEDEHRHEPWAILDEALHTLTDAAVRQALRAESYIEAIEDRESAEDANVAWLTGLLDGDDHVPTTENEGSLLLRDVRGWVGGLDERGQDLPLHLCLRLEEPAESSLLHELQPISDDVKWTLSLHLQSPENPDELIDAKQLWEQRAGGFLPGGIGSEKAQELLLAELGRASRVYSKIETSLSDTAPSSLQLTTAEAYEFLTDIKPLLEESGFGVIVPSWWKDPSVQIGARLFINAPELDQMRESEEAPGTGPILRGLESMVSYEWQIAIGDQPLSMEEFHALANQRSPLVRLRGRWVEICPEEIEKALRFIESQPGGEMPLLQAIRLGHGAAGKRIGLRISGLDATGWVEDLLGASIDEDRMPRIEQPKAFLGELRPYQKMGLSWMAFLDRFGLGACLADDMGLGKTIQMIALLLYERQSLPDGRRPGPTLLIVPTSLVRNWGRELERFAPELTYHVNHGPDRPLNDELVEIALKNDVVITTYGLVSRDRDTLMSLEWHRVVLDEAQYIKNPPTKQTTTIRALRTRRRVALTGTPVENRLAELWSIMEFLNPGYLGTAGEFRRQFAIPIERHRDRVQADRLRGLVQPFVLRRLKTDPKVIDDLPDCLETKEYATLTSEQASLYERTVNSMLGAVDQSDGIQRRGVVLATLVKLKQICDHPGLVTDDPIGMSKAESRKKALASTIADLSGLASRSGKLRRLRVMLEEILAADGRALIFTQFRRMGHLLTAMIQHELGCEALFLHGGTPIIKRQQMIDRFNDLKGDMPIFVLSLKAGGIGLNLTAANHVFHYDRWWNPAVENQATDRAFRIGQTRTVHVHKFVCMGTLEEHIDQMIEQKTQLAENIIGTGEQWLTELGTQQLREVLMLRDSAMEGES